MPCNDYQSSSSRSDSNLRGRNDELARLLCEATGLLVSYGYEAAMSDNLREHFSQHREADIIANIQAELKKLSIILNSDQYNNKSLTEIEQFVMSVNKSFNQAFVIRAVLTDRLIANAASELYNQNRESFNKQYIENNEFTMEK